MPKRTDAPRYYRVRRNGRAFWEPGPQALAFGLRASEPLGPEGPAAKSKAIYFNDALDTARAATKAEPARPPEYPPGSLGAFFLMFQESEAWAMMQPRTREDYHRAWPAIRARFGQTLISRITPDASERFHVDIHPAHRNQRDPEGTLKLSWNDAHRTLKVWRALLSALVAYRLIPEPPPIGRVANPAPKGREQVWLFDEVMALAFVAAALDYFGMAVAIRLVWDAMLSPVDVRQLTREGWRAGPDGGEVAIARAKTGARVYHAVTAETADLVAAYLERMERAGVALGPNDPLIRQPDGLRPYTKDRFEKHFRWVREAAFPGDARQMLDLRRSAATEARMGGADKDDLGKAMANTIDQSDALFSTYVKGASRRILAARAEGRARMAEKFRNGG